MITRNVGHYVYECLASIIEFVDELSIVNSNSKTTLSKSSQTS